MDTPHFQVYSCFDVALLAHRPVLDAAAFVQLNAPLPWLSVLAVEAAETSRGSPALQGVLVEGSPLAPDGRPLTCHPASRSVTCLLGSKQLLLFMAVRCHRYTPSTEHLLWAI